MKHYFKLGSLVLSFLLFFSLTAFSQAISKTSKRGDQIVETAVQQRVSVQQTTKPLPALSEESRNALNLFKVAHQTELTEEAFRKLMDTTATNLDKWKVVLAHFENDATTDLSFIRKLVTGMEQKLPLMD